MSDQPQHPAVLHLWNELRPILDKVANDCVGLKSQEFDMLKRDVNWLNTLITTGELPDGVEMRDGAEAAKPADNGKQPAEVANPVPRGERQQRRRKQRVADKETPAPVPAPNSPALP